MNDNKHPAYTVEDVSYVREPHMCRISFATTREAWEMIEKSVSWAHVMAACIGGSFGSDCGITVGSIPAEALTPAADTTTTAKDSVGAKQILHKHLQLLAEESAKTNNPEELCQFTSAMCSIADRLFSAPEKYTIQAGSISADRILPWDGSILECAQNTALMD